MGPAMNTTPDRVHHPVFGELRWEAGRDVWTTEYRDAAGELVEVVVNPGDGDRLTCLDRAADLYTRAVRAEPRILRTAIREELLELYNETWAVELPRLTAKQLAARLTLAFLKLWPDGPVPITLGYEAGDLFGGHSVDVEVDENLRFLDIDLVG